MKKFLNLIIISIIIITVNSNVIAKTNTLSDICKIHDIYGISYEAINTLSENQLDSLLDSLNSAKSINIEESYIKITYDANGQSQYKKSSLEEFLYEKQLKSTDQNGWMKIHTTIIDKDLRTAQVSSAFTWLVSPAIRLTDVIGLSITQGTFIQNSADGFYTYVTSQGATTEDFSGGFDYQGHGITKNVTLEKPNFPVTYDFMFLRGKIYKEGNSEGLNGAYAHKRISLNFNPSFSIDRQGFLSAVGVNIGMSYDTYKGFSSIYWK